MSQKEISRKDFLKGMGVVAVAGSLGVAMTGCTAQNASASVEGAPVHPFKYKKLDPAVAEDRGYNAYFDKGG